MALTLQFNTAGAWRNVLELRSAVATPDTVMLQAWALLLASGHERASARLIDERKVVVSIVSADLGFRQYPFGR